MKNTIPCHKTFKLLNGVTGVECWNFVTDDTFALPAGTLVRLEHVNDTESTVVLVVDAEGNSLGIELTATPRYFAHIHGKETPKPFTQLGYRFCINNVVLGDAIGVKLPKKTRDVVAEIIAYEQGDLDDKGTTKLFNHLRKSGLGKQLQGHYSSQM